MLSLLILALAVQDRTQILDRANTGTIADSAFSPDGKRLATCGNEIVLWDVETWKPGRILKSEGNAFKGFAWGPDGRWIAGITHRSEQAILILDASTGATIRAFAAAGFGYGRIAASPDGKRLAAHEIEAKKIRMLDVETGNEVLSIPVLHQPGFLRYSADGKILYSGEETTLRTLDAATGKEIRTLKFQRELTDLRIHPSGKEMVIGTGSGKETTVVEVDTGKTVRVIEHQGDVNRVAFDADGKRIVIAGDDYCKIYDYATAKVLEENAIPGGFEGNSGIYFHDRGRKLIAVIEGAGHVRVITLK